MRDQAIEHASIDIAEVAAVLHSAREGIRRDLVAGAEARTRREQRLRDARSETVARLTEIKPDRSLLDRLSRAWNEYGEPGGAAIEAADTPTSVHEVLERWWAGADRCEAVLKQFQAERAEHDARSRKLFARAGAHPTLPDAFRRDLWAMKALLDALPGVQDAEIERDVAATSDVIGAEARSEAGERQAALATLLAETQDRVDAATSAFGAQGLAWPDLLAQGWSDPSWIDARTRIGTFDTAGPGAAPDGVPCVLPFPTVRSLAIEAPTSRRDESIALARSVVLRVLANTPAGRTEVTFVDPVAVGASVADLLHLGDFDPRLVDTRPRTSSAEIEVSLAEHAAHVERVISTYLRGQFASLEKYNRAAGEMAESLRLLVVFDFPSQFSDRATEQLLSIIENGPKCGIFTLLVHDPDRPPSRDVDIDRLLRSVDRLRWRGDRISVALNAGDLPVDVVPDTCPELHFDVTGKPRSPAAELLAGIGAAARRTVDAVVDLERTFEVLGGLVDGGLATRVPVLAKDAQRIVPSRPDTWWSGTTGPGAAAPLGRTGAQDVASLHFSSTEIAGGALVVGLPRSGKTASLHAAILSMCLLYGPDELELYLIDAKHGVEFTIYRDLPHARMVVVNREREFAVAVLQSLDREIARRAELMKKESPGRTNIDEYRAATGAKLPRIVVVIDEFHEIFEQDDTLGRAAFDAFSDIVRQGPFAGVHLVLASQTLTGMPAMDRSTLMLLPMRLAFPCNESDAQLVMGDDNREPRFLERAGDGLLNAHRGNPTSNQRFRGTFVEADERTDLVARIVRKAAAEGFDRTPKVLDGDAMVSRGALDPRSFIEGDERPFRLRCLLGEALSLDAHLSVALRREQESNLLVVAPPDDDGLPEAPGMGVLHSVLLGASRQLDRVVVLDFTNDEGHPGSLGLGDLCDRLSVAYHRRHRAGAVIRELNGLVSDRVALEEHRGAGVLLVICGIGRASDLDPDAYSHGEDDDQPLAASLRSILGDGPDVGVHTTVVAESASALQRRLGPGATDLFGLRVAGRLRSDAERQAVLDDFRAIEVRGSQMVLFDRRTERRTKFQPYGPVEPDWIAGVAPDVGRPLDDEEEMS